jgi:hypothetical protein
MGKYSIGIPYSTDLSKNAKKSLRGIVYEYYCFNYLINHNKSIKFIRSKYNVRYKDSNNYFEYSSQNNVIYKINHMTFCEFDAIGIERNNIYLYEMTISNLNYKQKHIERKINILKLLFDGYIIHFQYIIPEKNDNYSKYIKKYDIMILPEPDYNRYFIDCKFSFSENIKRCISLKSFLEKSTKNSIVDEIINLSNNYFKNKVYYDKIYYKDIIFKLFNINQIDSNKFECYDFLDKKIKYINAIENRYYIKNKQLNIYDEVIINEIKNKLRGNCT